MKKYITNTMAVLSAILTLALFGCAQTAPQTNFSNIKIGNFGQMDDLFYRGAQPEPGDYASLAELGIKTIIDLRNDPTDYEPAEAEKAGMKYVNIPMSGWRTPKDKDVEQFLQIANDPATGPFFVHCKAGIHRTGVAGAVYRFTKYNWDYDQAYKEMKDYHFSAGWVHGALKSYVKKYARQMENAERPNVAVVQAAEAAAN